MCVDVVDVFGNPNQFLGLYFDFWNAPQRGISKFVRDGLLFVVSSHSANMNSGKTLFSLTKKVAR